MLKKISTILTSLVLVTIVLAGCSKAEQPFKVSPENSITIKSIDSSIASKVEQNTFYPLYSKYKTTGVKPQELQDIIDKDKKKDAKKAEEKYKDMALNGNKLTYMNIGFEENEAVFETLIKGSIDDYIKATRLNKEMNKKDLGYDLFAEFSKENPVQKTKDYMTKNKIVVKSIDFPKTFESKDLWSYPQVFVYKYTVNGEVNGKAFKTEVVEDFYFSYEFSEKGVSKVLISYIKDHPVK